MAIARVFWSGNSQAVRLPKGFRLPPGIEELEISREGEALILRLAGHASWPEDFWRAFEGMPDGFERPPQMRQDREPLST